MMQNSPAIQRALDKIGAFLSRPKLSNALTGLIIFFSATQFGLHFWPLSSLVYGIRIDYLSPTLYFLDLLIILYIVIKRSDLVGRPTRSDLTGTLTPILLVNLLFSQNPLATFSWSLHLSLYLLFLVTLGSDLKGSPQPRQYNLWGRSDPQGTIALILPLAMFFQVLLALTQVLLGHSLGGLMYYLGERTVAVGSPGIALATFMGHVALRAYGTFSHPNILAGWLVVSLLILFRTKLNSQFKLLFTLLAAAGVVLTESRAAALALFGLIIPFYLLKNIKWRLIYFAIILSTIYHLPSTITPPRSDLSLAQRFTLQGASMSIIRALPVFGSGAQASISTYPKLTPTIRLLQPDHDSFTLFSSWFGLFGLLATLSLWFRSFSGLQRSARQIRTFVFMILPLLLLDHYLLTSPQGLFILLIYLAVALNYSHAQKNLQ